MTSSPLLITGGTGLLGGHVVPLLRAPGRALRIATRGRRPPVDGAEHVVADLRRDAGLAEAVDGVGTILHLAGGPKGDDVATGHLMRAAAAAGVGHVVLISVVGADRVPVGYFRGKLGAEAAVKASGVPWTILRVAQFHDLVLGLLTTLARLPVLPIPRAVCLQPVDTREVAARLADLALAPPTGRVPDLVGPEVRPLADLARTALSARGARRVIAPVPLPPRLARVYRAGDNLALDATAGRRTWDAFLAERHATA
jgi:uncharacterized protein YbjT (DUF2867 family)